MASAALKRMTVDEFLVWEDGTDTRYELIDGVPVAMAPTYSEHQIIVANACRVIGNQLASRPPCHVRTEVGIQKPNSQRNWYQADIAVTCTPHRRREYLIQNPLVIVEVLSPTTESEDRKRKLPVYRMLPSVQEIVLIDSTRLYAEVHRRLDAARWETVLLTAGEEALELTSLAFSLPLAMLYENVDLTPDPVAPEAESP